MSRSTHSKEYRKFIALLRQMREESGLTQVQLASKIDVSQSHYSKYERGELRLDIVQLRAICIASGTSLAKFAKRLEDDLPKGR